MRRSLHTLVGTRPADEPAVEFGGGYTEGTARAPSLSGGVQLLLMENVGGAYSPQRGGGGAGRKPMQQEDNARCLGASISGFLGVDNERDKSSPETRRRTRCGDSSSAFTQHQPEECSSSSTEHWGADDPAPPSPRSQVLRLPQSQLQCQLPAPQFPAPL